MSKFLPKMDWKKFTYEFHLDLAAPSLFRHIVTVEAFKEAAMNLVLPPEWRIQLDRLNRVRAVYGTTALEGNPLSEAEVSHQLDILDQVNGAGVQQQKNPSKEQSQIRNSASSGKFVGDLRGFQQGGVVRKR